MIRIVNLAEDLSPIYPGGRFELACWEEFIRAADPELAELCLADMKADLQAGIISFDRHLLPVLNAAYREESARKDAIDSFGQVTDGLADTIRRRIGRAVEAEIILYPGLCSGAGWVTVLRGRDAILLGLEKIVELGWHDADAMRGLILHELGHVYQRQYGVLERPELTGRRQFLWQLYTEGVAMHFEQLLAGDPDYFHQDRDGWADWCASHLPQIKMDFLHDLDSMHRENQRYFGDWVRYDGHGDTGYYLGAKFVDHMCRNRAFDDVLSLSAEDVERAYLTFCQTAEDV